MATNYFEQLGFGRAMDRPMQVAGQMQGLRANEQAMDINQQNMQRQQQADQQKQMQAQQQAQRAKLADTTGLVYGALKSGQTERAAQLVAENEGLFKSLDPTFNAAQFSQMAATPEGAQQLNDELLQLTQVLAGPEQAARFAASQQPKPVEQMTPYQQASTELRKQELEIKREESKLQAMLKAQAAAANDIKKQELQLKIEEQKNKLADAQSNREKSKREADASLESGLQSTDNLLFTLDRILTTPRSVIESATGPISTRLPTLRQDTANFEELVGAFDAQAFVAQIPLLKGSGALSDAEGKKLSAALQNLSLRQGPDRLLENVKVAKELMDKARQNLIKKSGTQPSQQATQFQSQDSNVVDWSQL